MCALSCLTTIFLWCFARIRKLLYYDNAEHPGRFFGIYICFLAISLILSLLPTTSWIFLAFYIVLAISSNALTGLGAGTTLLIFTMFLNGTGSFTIFLMYFMAGLVGIALFQYIDETTPLILSIFVAVLMQVVTISAVQILFDSKVLSVDTFVIPAVNILLNCVVLFSALQAYLSKVILPLKNRYAIINDPEYALMLQMKEASKNDYYHSLHTAYLAERVATMLELNVNAIRTAAYYFKADKVIPDSGSMEEVMETHHFPDYARKIIRQLRKSDREPLEKESTVLLFCDNMITTLEYMADQNKEIEHQFEEIVNALIDRRINSGVLNHSKISVMDMNQIRSILLKERLYYDFIRINRS